jgi:hypothetical protein
MSRNIPKVRQWTVCYYMGRTLLGRIVVEAPNQLFAKWAARDRIREKHLDRYLAADRETISLKNTGVGGSARVRARSSYLSRSQQGEVRDGISRETSQEPSLPKVQS